MTALRSRWVLVGLFALVLVFTSSFRLPYLRKHLLKSMALHPLKKRLGNDSQLQQLQQFQQQKKSHHSMFKRSPEMRKIIITYLNNKFFADRAETDLLNVASTDELRVFCNQTTIADILIRILPPVSEDTIVTSVKELAHKFDGHAFLEGRQFAAKLLLDNPVWVIAGETVVKELVYVDSVGQKAMSKGKQLLSDTCRGKLEESLAEDGSPVISLSAKECAAITRCVTALNHGKGPLISARPVEKREADIESYNPDWAVCQGNHCKIDYYGSPNLFAFISDAIERRNILSSGRNNDNSSNDNNNDGNNDNSSSNTGVDAVPKEGSVGSA